MVVFMVEDTDRLALVVMSLHRPPCVPRLHSRVLAILCTASRTLERQLVLFAHSRDRLSMRHFDMAAGKYAVAAQLLVLTSTAVIPTVIPIPAVSMFWLFHQSHIPRTAMVCLD
jgi:hypothetical protein